MPLPSITKHHAKQCTALTKRTKQPCKNPAAYGCRSCRVHGAHSNILSGKAHPNWVHGERSKEWMKQNSVQLCELRDLESLGYAIGMMSGPRWRGRKPNS
jgi:hypothetical protein